VTLDDNTLNVLARKPKLIAEFPFVQQARIKSSCCGKKTAVDTNSIKQHIANLSEEAKQRFKELSGADSITVIYRDGKESQIVTF
jgi:hypothetical protein